MSDCVAMVFPRTLRITRCSTRAFALVTPLFSVLRLIPRMKTKQARTYQGAIGALNKLQTNQQYIQSAIINPKAETNIPQMKKFLKRTGLTLEILDKLPVIHIAGTNGKGTTCAYCEAVLRSHGYMTGFYSSPHLLDVRERIRVNGKPVSKTEFAKHFWKIYDMLDKQKEDINDMPLYFRYLTIVAFHIFLERKVDVAIMEVGIGGEYDCTNIVRNTVVAGITPLDFDHTALLGHTIESIAWNKGGIMKEGCEAFTVAQPGAAMNVLLERSLEKKVNLTVVTDNCYTEENNTQIPLQVQKINANLALAISEAFIKKDNKSGRQFSLDIAKKAIEETHWLGRYEIIQLKNSRFFLDGAHTLESITVCASWFKEKTANSYKKRVLIFNLTGDRNPEEFFRELSKLNFDIVIFTPNVGSEKDPLDTADFILTTNSQLERCEGYRNKWLELGETSGEILKVFPSFSRAVNFLDNENGCEILVTGSIHLIGAALSVLNPTLSGTLSE